jgi:hypothetical protein
VELVLALEKFPCRPLTEAMEDDFDALEIRNLKRLWGFLYPLEACAVVADLLPAFPEAIEALVHTGLIAVSVLRGTLCMWQIDSASVVHVLARRYRLAQARISNVGAFMLTPREQGNRLRCR